jgi:hypothetical protein
VPVTHYQVKFTIAKVNITGDPYQASLLQIAPGIFFMPGASLTPI